MQQSNDVLNYPHPIGCSGLFHSRLCALAARGMDTRRPQHYLGHASITTMSPEPFKDIWRD